MMDDFEEILKELEMLLTDLKIEVKYARGDFQGGFCRYKDKNILYLNRAQSIDNQVSLIVSELQKIDIKIDEKKLSPQIRKLLQKSSIN
jgi:hypothetical protein